MMKKNGFTLAEVLITLAIIGVVATLTLPSLMTNTGEQQAMTAYKKVMNTLNEAGQMNAALEGFDYSGVTTTSAGNKTDKISSGAQTLTALFNERLQVSEAASVPFASTSDHCKDAPVLVLRDGMALCLGDAKYDTTGGFWTTWVDTNGAKGPNKEATCGDEGCNTKASRHIFDQFPVTLYKGVAIPGHWSAVEVEATGNSDKAARYAMGIGKRTSTGS